MGMDLVYSIDQKMGLHPPFVKPLDLASGTSVRSTVGLILVRKGFNCFNFYTTCTCTTLGNIENHNIITQRQILKMIFFYTSSTIPKYFEQLALFLFYSHHACLGIAEVIIKCICCEVWCNLLNVNCLDLN
jgi:hypothetical protein